MTALASPPRDHREPGSAPRWRVGVGAAVVAVLVLLGAGIVVSAVSSASRASGTEVTGRVAASGVPSARATSLSGGRGAGGADAADSGGGSAFVHILGQVADPGLYEVDTADRAVDVVAAAGGFTAKADQGALNLARPVVDGEQIVVPAVGEAPPAAASQSSGAPPGAPSAGGPVNLNTADSTGLESLPGVGPATAQAILDWRSDNGRFESVDDLLDVTGIGDKKLERLRDSVTVR